MLCSYDERYLNRAQAVLGEAFDFAVNACHISGEDFIKCFLGSSVSQRIQNGEAAVITGESGIEIVMEIVSETTGKELDIEHHKVLSFEDLQNMYHTLHEADITKFIDIVDARMKEFFPDTNLRRIRTAYGCTQHELAVRSGVSLRSIQMYEQRNKDINKASVETVYRLAKVLGCTVEDLIEK